MDPQISWQRPAYQHSPAPAKGLFAAFHPCIVSRQKMKQSGAPCAFRIDFPAGLAKESAFFQGEIQ
jgi:hypothetical protein